MSTEKTMTDQSILWGHAVAFWDTWGVRAMLLGAVLGFLALVVSLFSSFVLWRVAGIAQGELETKTASLGNDIERQRRLTAEASERAAKFEKEAADVRLEQERLKAQLAWRVIPPNVASELEKALLLKRGAVNLRYIDGDPEALYLAIQLSQIFAKAHWNVAPGAIKPANTIVFGITIPDGGDAVVLRQAFAAAGVSFSTNAFPTAGVSFSIATIPGAPTLMVGSKQPALPSP